MIKSDNNEAKEQLKENYVCPPLLPLLLQYIMIQLTRTIYKKGSWSCCCPKLEEKFFTLHIP